MASFNNVRLAIHCVETAKSAFDDKIRMLNDVRTQLQNSWKCGDDKDSTFVIIQKIQNICNEGSTICQNAIDEANAALNDADNEKRRREAEDRKRKEEELKKREEEMRKRESYCQV